MATKKAKIEGQRKVGRPRKERNQEETEFARIKGELYASFRNIKFSDVEIDKIVAKVSGNHMNIVTLAHAYKFWIDTSNQELGDALNDNEDIDRRLQILIERNARYISGNKSISPEEFSKLRSSFKRYVYIVDDAIGVD